MNGHKLLDLTGWNALVSGGAGGIGRAIVEVLLAQGARVTVVDRLGVQAPARARFVACDLGDAGELDLLRAQIASSGEEFDLFVHCAGITADNVLWKIPPKDWDRVLRVNLDSAFHLLQIVVPHMRKLSRGRVVLISSINGERGKFGQTNYAASKAGLIGLCRSAARELGRFGVRVNAIAPGLIDTPMTSRLPEDVRRGAMQESALGTCGTPEDVARSVLFLCSDLSSHVTGQVLRVDGGQLTA
ncbi:MAG: SDR family NAD(P)-dependent oxidoreductase [Planctomycetota bacterium]